MNIRRTLRNLRKLGVEDSLDYERPSRSTSMTSCSAFRHLKDTLVDDRHRHTDSPGVDLIRGRSLIPSVCPSPSEAEARLRVYGVQSSRHPRGARGLAAVHKTYSTRRGELLLFSEDFAEFLEDDHDHDDGRRRRRRRRPDDDNAMVGIDSLQTVDELTRAVLNYGSKVSECVIAKTRSPPLRGAGKRRTIKFDPRPSNAAFSAVFLDFDKCRSDVARDVITSVAAQYVGMDVHATFDCSGLNIRLFGWPDLFYAFLCSI